MPTLFRYQPTVTKGPNGSTTRFNNTEDQELTELGVIDGWTYVSVPDGVTAPKQPKKIKWTRVDTITSELNSKLRRLRPIAIRKDNLRDIIEESVGDVHDLIADNMRLTEFALMLSLRSSREQLGGTPMTEEEKTRYLERIDAVLSAVESGEVLIRGDVENASDMMLRLMTRYSKINEAVRDHYKPEINQLLP